MEQPGEPRRFESKEAAETWIANTFAGWAASLSSAEQEALRRYKGSGYREVNEALRLGFPWGDPAVEQLVDDLDVALARFRLPEAAIAFRGMVTFTDPASLVGETLTDAAYTSTSLLSWIAEGFLSKSEDESEAVVAELLIPGGASVGAYVGAPDLVKPMGECELLLPRDSEFRVAAAEPPDVSHYWDVRLELIT